MTKRHSSIEDSRIVTIRDLKKERDIILQEFVQLEQKIDERFLTHERFDKNMEAIGNVFNQVQETIQNLGDLIVREVGFLREENREFRQRTAQLEHMGLINDRKIDDLDTRVLKLETAE